MPLRIRSHVNYPKKDAPQEALTRLKATPPRPTFVPWSPDEDAVVRRLYGTTTAAELTHRLCRTYRAIQQRAAFLGVTDRRGA